MSDESVAAIARELSKALLARAKTRHPDEDKLVRCLQSQLVQEVGAELDPLPPEKVPPV